MKRLIVLALALALILAMTACASTSPSTNPFINPSTTQTTTQTIATARYAESVSVYDLLNADVSDVPADLRSELSVITNMATVLQQTVAYIEKHPTCSSFRVKGIEVYESYPDGEYHRSADAGDLIYDATTGVVEITINEHPDGPNVFRIGQKTLPNCEDDDYYGYRNTLLKSFEDRDTDPNSPWFSFTDESIDTAPFSPERYWSAWTEGFTHKWIVTDQLHSDGTHFGAPYLYSYDVGDFSLVAQSRTRASLTTLAEKYRKGEWDGSLVRRNERFTTTFTKISDGKELVTWDPQDYVINRGPGFDYGHPGAVLLDYENGWIWSHTWIFPEYGAFDQYSACTLGEDFVAVTEQGFSVWRNDTRTDYSLPNTKRVVFSEKSGCVFVLTDEGCYRVSPCGEYDGAEHDCALNDMVNEESTTMVDVGVERLEGCRLCDYTSDKALCLVETPDSLVWITRFCDAQCDADCRTPGYLNLPALDGVTAVEIDSQDNIVVTYNEYVPVEGEVYQYDDAGGVQVFYPKPATSWYNSGYSLGYHPDLIE